MSTKVRLAASVVGSLWYEVATSLQRVLDPDDYELDIDWSTHGQLNVLAVGEGSCDIGVTMPPFLDWAMRRRGPLAAARVPKLVVLAAVNQTMWLAAAADRESGFRTLGELAAARHPWKPITYPVGGELLGLYTDRLLELHGFSREQLKSWGGDDPPPFAPLPPGPVSKDALVAQRGYPRTMAREGKATGLLLFVNLTSAWARDIGAERDLSYLGFDAAALDTLVEEFGAERITLPARLFSGVDQDVATIGWRHQYVYGREDTDAELVRSILGALEQPQFLDNAQGISYSALEPQLISGVELHPAAQEWYRKGGSR